MGIGGSRVRHLDGGQVGANVTVIVAPRVLS